MAIQAVNFKGEDEKKKGGSLIGAGVVGGATYFGVRHFVKSPIPEDVFEKTIKDGTAIAYKGDLSEEANTKLATAAEKINLEKAATPEEVAPSVDAKPETTTKVSLEDAISAQAKAEKELNTAKGYYASQPERLVKATADKEAADKLVETLKNGGEVKPVAAEEALKKLAEDAKKAVAEAYEAVKKQLPKEIKASHLKAGLFAAGAALLTYIVISSGGSKKEEA